MAPTKPNISNAVLNTVLSGLKEDLTELKSTMKSMADTLSKLATIEARQTDQSQRLSDAFIQLNSLGTRVSDVEIAMPGLKELRRWVVAGMVAGIGMMFVSVVSLVMYPKPIYLYDTTATSSISAPGRPVFSIPTPQAPRADPPAGTKP